MDASKDGRRNEELAKLHFEFFKHLTTLGVAATLAVLGIYRELVTESLVLGLALAAFGVCTLVSLFGMLESTTRFERGRTPSHRYKRLEAWAVVSLGTGVLASTVGVLSSVLGVPLDVPLTLAWIVVIIVAIRRRRSGGKGATDASTVP